MPRWIFSLVQFAPLSVFAAVAFAGGPAGSRWELAFELASLVALVQLAIVLPQRRPANRLVLAANLYLLLGGLAFLTRQWSYLALYEALRASAIFLFMLGVGCVTALVGQAGYIGVPTAAPRHAVFRASLVLLLATAAALAMSVLFRGERYLAAVFPIIALALLQRWLVRRVQRLAVPEGAPGGTRHDAQPPAAIGSPASDIAATGSSSTLSR